MTIIINGIEKTHNAPMTLSDLLDQEGYSDKIVAVAVNGSFVPKENHANTDIEKNDQIEIVAPQQGG